MISRLRYPFFLLWMSLASLLHADALMVNRSVEASSIAQYYIDEQGVRVELEIGLNAIDSFRNLMPDAIYQKLGHSDAPLDERLGRFFGQDLAILVDGLPLPGFVQEIGPAKRILRDPVNGTPLPVQDGAPDVIRAVLVYPFVKGALPTRMGFTAPQRIDIGFVMYHKGVAINDYRYLAPGLDLELDWGDPWYSSFTTRQMKRQYSAPMSGFIYVENFEVRKEIIVRPKDLQRYIDLGLEGRTDIPVLMQPDIKSKVGDFLSRHHPVTIDGKQVSGILHSVNFLERTLTSSRVVDPPEPLDINAAVMGAIFVYPLNELPQKVVMEWDLWDDRVQRIPVSAVDQAGPLPSYLERDWPELEWNNYLKNPDIPTLRDVEMPVASWRLWLQWLLPVLVILALVSVLLLWRARSGKGEPAAPAVATFLFLVAAIATAHYSADNKPEQARAEAITGDLLHNVYRAFDFREESDIYDMLARSVAGDLLTDIYLETKRSLVLANQGGAAAKVKNVELAGVEVLPGSEQGRFQVKADWTVNGSVGHWGHVHQRSNRYLANLTIAVDDGQWKLQEMSVLQEERL